MTLQDALAVLAYLNAAPQVMRDSQMKGHAEARRVVFDEAMYALNRFNGYEHVENDAALARQRNLTPEEIEMINAALRVSSAPEETK